jgi:hypothetical protein
MLKADQQVTGGAYQGVIQKVFMDRKILNRTDLQKEFLPELKLPKTLDSKSEALSFARHHKSAFETQLPSNLKVDSMYTNKAGETFINYSFNKDIPVQGEGLAKFKDCVTKVYGGLNLAFDNQGKLMSLQEDTIDSGKIKDALNEIKSYDQSGLILTPRTKAEGERIFNKDGELYRAIVEPTRSGKKVLQKLPVID